MTFAEGPPREPDTGQRPETDRTSDRARPHAEHKHRDEEESEGHIGIFRSWRSLYVTVILYTTALTVLLYVLTRLLDYSS